MTIKTVQNITDDMKIVDDDGISQDLSRKTVINMIGIAWGTFILAWIMNIAYYKVKTTLQLLHCEHNNIFMD